MSAGSSALGAAANTTPQGAIAFSIASTISNLANKAFQHSARAKRASQQKIDAGTIGVTYECVRQFDAGIAAGLKTFAPCQGGSDTRCKTAAGSDCDFTKVAANRGIAAAANVNNNGTNPDPNLRGVTNPDTGKIVQSVTKTTPNSVTKDNPFGNYITSPMTGGASSPLILIGSALVLLVLMFGLFGRKK